jgi:hypothetical protein
MQRPMVLLRATHYDAAGGFMELACTKKLLSWLDAEVDEVSRHESRLGYWACKYVVYRRRKYVIALNRETMVTLVVAAAPRTKLRDRLAEALSEGLSAFRVDPVLAGPEVEAMRTARFTTNSDRSLLGSLNDHGHAFTSYMDAHFDGSTGSLQKVAAMLTDTPHSNRDPVWADESIEQVFGPGPSKSMTPFTHTNRKGDVYYLHRFEGKNGRDRYTFSKKQTDGAVEQVPDGWEVFEKVTTGQVFLRRRQETKISELDRALVARGLEKHAPKARLEITKDSIVVYERTTPTLDGLAGSGRFRLRGIDRILDDEAFAQYSPAFRFLLVDDEARDFEVQRWHFGLDEWIHVGFGKLSDIAELTLPHLAQESFFEL